MLYVKEALCKCATQQLSGPMTVISDAEFTGRIPERIRDKKTWVVGLSGGADSLCLVMLANNFAKRNNIALYAAIVDHKLRPESSAEILPVLEILEKNDVHYEVLVWEHQQDIGGNLEQKARDARYRILRQFCRKIDSTVLMTAHHALDQWETFFMRLSRGSSTKGLATIHPVTFFDDILLVRPLLDFEPQFLAETLFKRFDIKNFVVDPSNADPRFERTRWRGAYGEFAEKHGLSINNVNKSIARIQVANDCLDSIVSGEVAKIFDGKYVNIERFKALHIELKRRVLDIVIKKSSTKKKKIISYELLQRTALEICKTTFVGTSLGGVVLRKDKTKNIRVLIEMRQQKTC
jgi:tRNA(Ile)-lysidine synthase